MKTKQRGKYLNLADYTRIDNMLGTSADDLRISVKSESDVFFLEELLAICHEQYGNSKTKIKIIEAALAKAKSEMVPPA